MQNPMLFKNGVVSESIAGVRQFRTRAQTNKNTKQRKDEFAISSGSPPPTGPDPQAFLVLCLAVPGFQRHRFPSKGKGREVNTTCNRRSLHPPDATRIWRSNCAQKRKGLGPSNHQTPTWDTKTTQQAPATPIAFQNRCGCINGRGAAIPHQGANQQSLKKEKASSPFLQGVHLQQVQVRKPSWCCVWWFQGVSDIVSPPKGKGREVNTACNRSSLHPPQCNPHLEEQLRTKAQRPWTDTPPNQQAPTWETKAKGQQPQQPNAFQNRCGE